MRLGNRTGLVAGLSVLAAVIVATGLASLLFTRSVSRRVDEQLQERARAAPVLAAVGPRIGISELAFVVDGARVDDGRTTVGLGTLPSEPLPPLTRPGWRTVDADGEDWRLYAVEVRDVPNPGDRVLVEFVEPLGDVDAQVRSLRRGVIGTGALAALVIGGLGVVAGRRAARPLTDLAAEVRDLGRAPPTGWQVEVDTTTPEVADIAAALNHSLALLAEASRRREEALEAARSFASAASHELRTPLQGAMTNLDVVLAGADALPPSAGAQLGAARAELDRLRGSLDAVRRLSEAELIGPEDFEEVDLGDLVDEAVGALAAELAAAELVLDAPDGLRRRVWAGGVRLAVENLVRNAVRHGRTDGTQGVRVEVTVSGACIRVDDAGPGIPEVDRDRLRRPFERGRTSASGSGLGLAFVDRVAAAHGGRLQIDDSPSGGARVELWLGPSDADPGSPPGR